MIIGIDPMGKTYQIMTDDNRSIAVKASDIDKAEKPKDDLYQQSGVNPEKQNELSIVDTPFDLDPEK